MEEVIPQSEIKPLGPSQRIEATLVAKLSLADYQNAIPPLRELGIVNDSEQDAEALELLIESAPAFLKPKTWRVDNVGAGQRVHITDLDIQLDPALLTRLTEAEKATVSFVLRRATEPPEELARLDRALELLPRNQCARAAKARRWTATAAGRNAPGSWPPASGVA